jgi:hypothetical protein
MKRSTIARMVVSAGLAAGLWTSAEAADPAQTPRDGYGVEADLITGAKLERADEAVQFFYILGLTEGLAGLIACPYVQKGAIIAQTQGLMREYPDASVLRLVMRAQFQLGCRAVDTKVPA